MNNSDEPDDRCAMVFVMVSMSVASAERITEVLEAKTGTDQSGKTGDRSKRWKYRL